jgi:hypothetical protein
MWKMILITALAAAVVVPTTAQAGIGKELKASDQVERVLNHRHPAYHWLANCRQISRHGFTCSISGYKGNHFADGRARVREVTRYRYKAKITALRFS